MLLPDGKATISRVEVVIFDAMYTVIEPKIPRFFHVLNIFEDVLGIRVQPRLLAQYLRESEKMAEEMLSGAADYQREWIERNRYIASRLLNCAIDGIDPKRGLEIHLRVISHEYLYEVKPAMRNFLTLLTKLANPPKLVLASNQYDDFLIAMMKEMQLHDFFGPRVFTSDGLVMSKPNPEFFARIIGKLGYQPEQALVVGNSAKRDLPPAKACGIPICLYDRRGKLELPPEPNVFVARTIAEMQNWLLSRLISGWAQEEAPSSSLLV